MALKIKAERPQHRGMEEIPNEWVDGQSKERPTQWATLLYPRFNQNRIEFGPVEQQHGRAVRV